MQKVKVKGQSVQKTEWKQRDGWTVRRTDGGYCINSCANAVGNKLAQTDLGPALGFLPAFSSSMIVLMSSTVKSS